MKFIILLFFLLTIFRVVHSMKLVSSSSRILNRRQTKLVKRLIKRQLINDPNCDRHQCHPVNCGKDFVASRLPGQCCDKCVVPWQSPQSPSSSLNNHRRYSFDTQSPLSSPSQRVDVYIFGPDDGSRVVTGQTIYFDCEVISPYYQNVQPKWSRRDNQAFPSKILSEILPGNRQLVRLTIRDATQIDRGIYECNAQTGNTNDFAFIDLQVIDEGDYPQGIVPSESQRSPPPQPSVNRIDEEDDHIDDRRDIDNESTTTTMRSSSPSLNVDEMIDDEGEYPEDYSESE